MAAVNFPSSPATNDIFTSGDISWKWNGSTWVAQSATTLSGYGITDAASLSTNTFTGLQSAPNYTANAVSGAGYGFFASNATTYGVYMANYADSSGGRLDSTSDFNIYYKIGSGTNRGHVFKGNSGAVVQITGEGQIYISPTSSGTAPFVLSANATAVVSNLNADKLDGLDSTAFALVGSGNSLTGNQTTTGYFRSSATGEAFGITAGTTTSDSFMSMRNSSGNERWRFGIDGDGTSNLQVERFNSSGVYVDKPFSISASDGSLDLVLKNGAWYNGADAVGRLYFTASGANYYKSANGTHEFRNAADAARFTIDTSGNVTMVGKLGSVASTTSAAGIVIPHGTAPTTPTNGDLWTTTTGALVRINGATKTFAFTDSSITGSAATLTTGRTLAITGDLTWTSPSFDGSGNVTAAGTLATVNSNVGTWGTATQVGAVTVNAKGLVTAASHITITPAWSSITSKPTTISGYGLTDAVLKTGDTMTGNLLLTGGGTYSEPASVAGVLSMDTTGGDFTISSRSNGGNTALSFRTSASGTGAERMRITSAGNTGIGISPLVRTHVYGTAAAPSGTAYNGLFMVQGSTSAQLEIGLQPASPYGAWLQMGDTTRTTQNYPILLQPVIGNVGIGTTAPATKLDVNGSTRVQGYNIPSTGTGVELVYDSGLVAGRIFAIDRGGSVYKDMRVDGLSLLLQASSGGNVGIGTTTPGQRLVVGDITAQNTARINGLSTANMAPILSLFRSGAAEWAISAGSSAQNTSLVIGNNPAGYSDAQLNSAAKLVIDASGNVGVGNTSPAYKLHTVGTVSTNANNVYTGSQFGVTDSAETQGIYVRLKGANAGISGSQYANQIFTTTGNAFEIYQAASSPLVFGTSALERLRIDASGNVGIGTTNPVSKLVVSSSGAEGIEFYPADAAGLSRMLAYNRNDSTYDDLALRGITIRLENSSGAEVMRTSGTNVGIGASTPTARLTINGGSLASAGSDFNVSANLTTGRLLGTGGGTLSSVHTFSDAGGLELTSGSSAGYVTGIGIGARSFTGNSADAITFWTRSVERAKIDNAGVMTIGGNTVWHAGNDGASSTLDADLLDGQEGSYYQSASNLNAGTLPAARMPALTGDITTSAGAVATTLATVNSNVGSFGSTSAVPVITVNGKGLVTAVSTAALGTAAVQNTGTSGANIPFLNGTNTWANTQTFSTNALVTGFVDTNGVQAAVASKTANYTLTTEDYLVLGDTTSGGFTLTLPTAVGSTGQIYVLKKMASANTLTIATTSAQTIDGSAASTYNMTGIYDFIRVQSDGANWVITDRRLRDDTYNSLTAVAVTTTSYFLGGNIYAGGGGLIGWQSSTNLTNPANGTLKINTSASALGTLQTGGVQVNVVAKTANYTATVTDYLITCDATSAGFTVTLPTAVGCTGQTYVIKKITAANVITMATTSSQTIDGAAAGGFTLSAQWDTLQVVSDGANWIRADKSTAAVKVGTQTLPVNAGSMTSRTTNGPAVTANESTTNKVMYVTLDFDQSTAEYAQFMVPMPKSWNEGTVTAQFYWTATTTGNVVWGIQGLARSDDDAIDTAFGTAVTVTDSVTASGDLMISAVTSAMTIGGTPAENDLVHFQVYRDAASGSDTLAADAKLMSVKIFVTYNAGDDS